MISITTKELEIIKYESKLKIQSLELSVKGKQDKMAKQKKDIKILKEAKKKNK